jgi:outer membrane receptor protein involved in Fe transport
MRQSGAALQLVVVILFLLALAPPVNAQKTTGDITGTVSDSTGAVLPGASVTAVCTDTNLTRTGVTDAQGGFRLAELPICVYRVTAELQGFKVVSRAAPVAANAVAKVDFKLEVGTVSETVTVEAVSPLVEFSDKLNNRVDSQRIEQIPLSGRDFNSLLGVMPGVQHTPGGGFLGVNISGARTTSNNYMVDGISNNDRYYGDSVLNQTGVIGVPASLVPMDAIGDFTVQLTPSAEFGVKGGAAINVVMKSGTNAVHGSGYYFRHDDWTDSPNFFVKKAGGDTTPVKNQQYGATFGGPLRKDKTFFFGYFEGQRLNVISPYDTPVPRPSEVAAARARIAAAGLQTSAIGENLIKLYPTDPSGQQHVQGLNISNMSTFSIKVDHQLNASNLINERFFWATDFQSAPSGNSGEIASPDVPIDYYNSVTDPTRVALVGFVWNSTLSSRTLLETRFGFNQISQTIDVNNKVDPTSLGINTGPLDAADFGIPGVNSPFGHIGGIAGYPITTAPTTTTQVSSALTATRGQQTLKIGGSFEYAYNRSVRNRARTSLTVNGGSSDNVDALVGLLLARFDSASRSFGSTERHMHQSTTGLFVNDDWKASSRLTLSAGLRWEIFEPLTERDNVASNFFPDLGLVRVGTNGLESIYNAEKANFGPRAGLAWDVTGDGRTSMRAGYALTYDAPQFGTIHSPGVGPGSMTNPDLGVFSYTLSGTAGPRPDDPRATCVNPNNSSAGGNFLCLQPGVAIFGSSPGGVPPFNAFGVPTDLKAPRYHYFHASVQREFLGRNAITVSYVGSRGQDLIWIRDINAPPLGSPIAAPDLIRPFRAQFPNLRHVYMLNNDSKSWYDSVQLSVRQNNWRGVNTQYNYTLGKCEDYNSGNRDGTGSQRDNPYDPANNKGPCGSDVRHNFNLAGTYTIPDSKALGDLTRGWSIGAVYTALSGRPFSPTVPASFDRSGQNTGWLRASCSGDPVYSFDPRYLFPNATTNNSIVTNQPPLSVRTGTDQTALLSTPAIGAIGTCGRDSYRRAGLSQLDVNILKQFRLGTNTRIQARWEIFNLLNRVNLGSLQSTNVRSGVFGTIGSTPDVDRGNPVIAQGGPRAMQWAVKVLF